KLKWSSSPRATVPGTRGRADIPSAKKSLGSSGSYLGWLAIFCLHASAANRSSATRVLRAASCVLRAVWDAGRRTQDAAPGGRRLPRDISDLPRMQRFQKGPGLVQVELRIALLHDEEELVARGLVESLQVEHRVIRHGQAVEGEHAEHRGERGQQDRALECDRDPGRPRVVRLAADVERVLD